MIVRGYRLSLRGRSADNAQAPVEYAEDPRVTDVH